MHIVTSYNVAMGIKYAVNEGFFSEWSNEMAYVLGFIFADGSLEDSPYIRGKYLRICNTDQDRIEAIKRLLSSSHTIVKTEAFENRKSRYLLRIGNHALYDSLVDIGVTPRKSFTMQFPSVPPAVLPHFVRGYFDGDGCVHIAKSPTGTARLLTIFTSGSKHFLEELHARLCTAIDMKGSALHKHGSTEGAFQLRYFARDSIRLFNFMYPPSLHADLLLRRKYDIFMRYFDEVSRSEGRRMSKYIPRSGLMVKG